MKTPSRLRGASATALGAVAALLIALGAFYFVRTSDNAADLTRRNLRQLDRAGQGIAAAVDAFAPILTNLLQPDEYCDPLDTACENALASLEDPDDLRVIVRNRVGLVPGLTLTELHPDAEPDGKPLSLSLELSGSRLHWALKASAANLAAWADLEPLVGGLLESDLFEHVVLTDASGSVLLARGRAGHRLDALPPLEGEEGEAAGPPVPRQSAVREIAIAGEGFHLFSQPIRLATAGGDGEPIEWALVGLVSSRRFRGESLALDSTELVTLLILLTALVLAWPFLKLWSMGAHEAVEVRDVLFMGFSLSLGAGLLSLCLVDLSYYQGLKKEVDQQLAGVANGLLDRFEGELDDALATLDRLSEHYVAQKIDRGRRSRRSLRSTPPAVIGYPPLEMIFWVGTDGMQRDKWALDDTTTSLISVEDREYFRRVRDGRLWPRPRVPGGEASTRGYFLDTIRSRTTGENLVVVSSDCIGRSGWAAVMMTRLLSLQSPLLPVGFRFALLDSEGRIVLPAPASHSLEVNFVEEAGNDRLLRSALSARASRHLDVAYLGKDVRLFLKPIAGTELTLVTVYDKTHIRTINLETLALSWFLFVGFGLTMLIFFVCLAALRPRSRMAWLWPDRERPEKYLLLIVIPLFFGAALGLQALLSPRLLLVSTFSLPLAAVGVALAVLSRGLLDEAWRRRAGWGWAILWTVVSVCVSLGFGGGVGAVLGPIAALAIVGWGVRKWDHRKLKCPQQVTDRLYLASVCFAVLVCGMLPAAFFFRVVYFDHLKLHVKNGQLEMAKALEARRPSPEASSEGAQRARVLAQYARRDERWLDTVVAPFFESCYRLRGEEWICPSGEEPDLESAQEGRDSARVLPLIGDQLPFYTPVSVATRHLYESKAGDGSWAWWVTEKKSLLLEIADGASLPVEQTATGSKPTGQGSAIFSHIPTNLAVPSEPLWGLAFLAGAVGLYGLVLFLTKRVYLVGFEKPHSLDMKSLETTLRALASDDPGQVRLLVSVPPSVHLEPLGGDSVFWTEMKGQDPPGAQEKPGDKKQEKPGDKEGKPKDDEPQKTKIEDSKVVMVHCSKLDELSEESSLAWIEWLEEQIEVRTRSLVLCAEGGHLLGVSRSIEGSKAESEAEEGADLRRWRRLLARFSRVVLADPGSDLSKEKELAEERCAEKGQKALKRCRTAVGFVCGECSPRQALGEIGRRLLSDEELPQLSRRGVIQRVRADAEPYYAELWRSLPADERLLVAQLARGAVMSPQSRVQLGRLMARGVLVLEPDLRLFNESFASHVRETVTPEHLETWSRGKTVSTWQRVRRPLLTLLLAVVIFLFATQRELFDSTLALISALTLALPGFFKLMGFMRSTSAGADSGG